MVELANRVLSSNHMQQDITLIPKLSNDIIIPEDMPNRCSLVVTETVDAALFGERILQTIIHAWENLISLSKKTDSVYGEIIPFKASLYVTPIQCLKIARMNYVFGKERLIDNIIKLDKSKLTSSRTEPYDTENLRLVEHKCLSYPEKIFQINFNNIIELKQYLNGDKNIHDSTIKCTKEGFVDALSVWFDLYLDENIVVTSSPKFSNNRCWDQAIFPLNQTHFVEENSLIKIKVGCTNGELSASVTNVSEPNEGLIEVPQEMIKYLNCLSLQSIFTNVMGKLKSRGLLKSINKVLDLSPFPVLGFLFSKQCNADVISVAKIDEEKFNCILKENNINRNKFENITWKDCQNLLKNSVAQFDIIVLHCIQTTGEFNDDIINHLSTIRYFLFIFIIKLLTLHPNGFLLPSQINVRCILVDSLHLTNGSEVTNPLLMTEINVAEHINHYKVPYHIDLKVDEIIHKTLSMQFTIGQLNIENLSLDENVIFEKEVEIIEEGCLNAILYWFDCIFIEYSYSTIASDSFINQCAWLISPRIEVKKSDIIKIRAIYHSCFLYFSVEKCKR
uniref:Protein arginine N-methyltransferase domain-containing protein n=1 Tax=Rhodnius prolixus TaxID=13249 RepID=T1HPT3_RHOPR